MTDRNNTMLVTVAKREISGSEVNTVDAKELHDFLKSKQKYSDWFKNRIKQYKFIENQDFIIFSKTGEKSGRGRPPKEYYITLDMAKEISMVERTERGREARRYFIECERKLLQRQSEPVYKSEFSQLNREEQTLITHYVSLGEESQKQLSQYAHAMANGSPIPQLPTSTPTLPATPIVYQRNIILMIHQAKGDFVSLRTLCEATHLDYKHQKRMVKQQGYNVREVPQNNEKVLCLSYQSAIDWLKAIKPEKVRLNKRHWVIRAIMDLPGLLEDARKAYREPAVLALPSSPGDKKTRTQLIKALEKIEGEKIEIIKDSVIKKALRIYKNFDDQLTQVKVGSTAFVVELLGDTI